jgi:hypothetical protein
MPKNVYNAHSGICPKCGAKLPVHWQDDKCPTGPKDTEFIRICPNCGGALYCEIDQQSNS